MGKIRKLRQKYNASLAKQDAKDEFKSSNPKDIFKRKVDNFLRSDHKVKSIDKLSKVIAKKSNLRKSDKRLHRRKLLQKKIDTLSLNKKEIKEKKKRQKTVITGDMKPLVDALPSLDELLSVTQRKRPKSTLDIPNAKRLKNKERKAMIWQQDIQTFNKVLNHSSFQASPFESISAYLKNKISEDH